MQNIWLKLRTVISQSKPWELGEKLQEQEYYIDDFHFQLLELELGFDNGKIKSIIFSFINK